MTRALNLTRPIRCARCPERFTRTRGNQRLCPKHRRRDVVAAKAARPTADVPDRLDVLGGRGRADRETAVRIALSQARNAVKYIRDLRDGDERDEILEHAKLLVEYAERTAAGDTPPWRWQVVKLGFAIRPCDGR